MAASLIDSMVADFDPTQFTDDYRDAMAELIERKRSTGDTRPGPAPATAGDDRERGMTDLLAALERSVEAARDGRAEAPAVPEQRTPTKPTAKKDPAKKDPTRRGHRSA